jgi:hypothetical protein
MEGARFVVVNDELGVFMGADKLNEHAAWSSRDTLGRTTAQTFANEDEAKSALHILAHPGKNFWQQSPDGKHVPPYRLSQVFPTTGNNEATRQDVLNAGLPAWAA